MKKILRLTFGLLVLCNLNVYAQNIPTIREQLEELNKYWKQFHPANELLNDRTQLNSDVELIKTHLFLVESYLRENKLKLTEMQLQNRYLCLDVLKDYRENGVFPINLYHAKRTPYFIDNFGTACAVGQLIISTGHEELAKKISSENNYAYIENLNYPELIAWADNYGFSLDELKWIQPTYGCSNIECANDTKMDVSCYGGYDGCFGAFPTTSLNNPPFMYQYFELNVLSNSWSAIPVTCDLPQGSYKCRVTDSGNNIEEFFYDIEQPDSISIQANVTDDDGSCNGVVSVSFSGGNAPYRLRWLHDSDTATSIAGLCSGTYAVLVIDSSNCSKEFNVLVDLVTGLSDFSLDKPFRVFPNPTNTHFTISYATDESYSSAFIYDYTGKLIQTYDMSHSNILDVSHLNDGIYLLKIGNHYQRIVKNSH